MRIRTMRLLIFAGVLGIASILGFGLWDDYVLQRTSNDGVLAVRADTILSSLKAGIRSHSRGGGWRFSTNIEGVTEEIALVPGIVGVAVYDAAGDLLVNGGKAPLASGNDLKSLAAGRPRWFADSVVFFEKSDLSAWENGTGSRGGGEGRGRGGGGTLLEDERRKRFFKEPVWLVVSLERSTYDMARNKALRRFAISIGLMLTVVLLGLAIFALIHRQSRLAAQLSLARERETRFEERSLLGAGLAHETKNPLCLIRGLAQSLLRKSDAAEEDNQCLEDEFRSCAQQVIDEVDQVVGRINAFLEFARAPSPEMKETDLREVLAESSALFRDEAQARGVEFITHMESARTIADSSMVRQIIVNLLTNAMAACDKGDALIVELRPAGDETIHLTVRDTGEGIAPEDLPEVRKPYFTRKEGGGGMGLAIVDQIVQSHDWQIDISSEQGEGTTVRITIPEAD